ncbi:hypothetical protein BUALT_Bualt03G0036700 [Buddleja alternifolia]|uniref:GDSL esterase/lipase At1g29670-like n=1 Tax=Buddleja alternifolia TaxID=168488 RepID=A0AAV6XXM9_9LAMI|nr:hypothetical protein BUALT_Bualt03G0036700 [Buddleja alternifolia]
MAPKVTKWILLAILSFVMKPEILIQGQQQVPCLFFMGDSQFDNGNNNALLTTAKANYQPYGIDYPDFPPSRFSNGRNIADFIAQFLGFAQPIPPFATARGSEILKGVNYASGAAGILDESGRQLGDRISLNKQLLINHQITISRIALSLRNRTKVNEYLSKCLYAVNMGSNDYINNYLLPQYYPTSVLYTPDRFAEFLIRRFSGQLRILYNSGARKVAVFGIGLLGCLPQELARFPTNGSACVDSINNIVQLFNDRLVTLIGNLNTNLPGAQFTYINITSISSGDPTAIGIRVVNAPCCIVSATTGQCVPNQVPCSNRNEYVFWDNFHPTEIVNLVTATRAYNATVPSDAYPVDILRLVQQ